MGIGEQIKGRLKQAAGDVTDNDALKTEGEAQSDKGIEETKQTEAQASAKAHEEKAEMYDKKQEAAES